MKVDFENILYQAQKGTKLCIAWYILNEQVIKAEVRFLTIKKDRNELVFMVQPGSGKYIEEMISGSCRINLYIEDESLLFGSELKSYDLDEGTLVVGMPDKYKFFDRRDKSRLDAPQEVFVEFSINDRAVGKRCLDISAGGCSIVLSQDENRSFRIKEKSEFDIKIRYGESVLELVGLVVKIIKLSPFKYENCPYGGARVSIQFKGIHELAQQKIKKYIQENQELIAEL